jgi:2,5-furandicarboxylate decarboxylase 1
VPLDLRTFLDGLGGHLLEVSEPVSVVHEMTALQHELDRAGRFPVLRFSKPRLASGALSTIAVVNNLTASRVVTAAALGVADHRRCAEEFARRTARAIEPEIVERDAAPVQEVVLTGDAADLTSLPVLTQHELEPGPYLTAAHATTFDPDTGTDNTAIQRCWIMGPRQMSWMAYPASHNARNIAKFRGRGEPCPVAFWIGHHPAIVVGTQAKLDYPQSHWSAAGGVAGAPLRLVPSVTHGERIMVPADAEIVIEGWVRPGAETADGPFGEYTGYLGPQTRAALCEISCVTRRADAIYHDYGSGLTDMLVPDNIAMEGKLYSIVKAVAPSLINVHVPVSGRRFHAYLQFDRPARGEVRDALAAALAYRRCKAVFAVDADVDIFAADAMLWALATRVQWSRDSFVLDGLSTSTLDPSLPSGAQTGSKIGVYATLPPAAGPKRPRAVPPAATVPQAATDRVRALLAGTGLTGFPEA